MQENYEWCYRTLGIEAGCGWPELRRAYQRQVRAWHPDRYPAEHPAHPEANERIKAVNIAFDRLADHYQRHGRLPAADTPVATGTVQAPAPEAAPPATAPPAPDEKPARAGARHEADFAAAWVPPDAAPGRAGGLRRMALVVAILALTYWLWPTASLSPWLDAGIDPDPGGAPPPIPESRASAPYFTTGSSLGDVYTVQGQPTHTEEGVWHYGASRVYFENGRVSRWEHDARNPLRASLPLDTTAANRTSSGFTMGSTKAEVLAAQGRPLRAGDEEWDYGASKVYFDNGRVSGWQESYLNPLHVRRD
ncbi:MAG TPA: J domain-containing protein [Acidiferrobacterales bacterium]